MRTLSTAAVLLLLANAPEPAPKLCVGAAAVTGTRACAESDLGIAIADTAERARQLLDYAKVGEAKFRTRFARSATRYAVLESELAPSDSANIAQLRAAGFTTVLPWPSAKAYRAQVEQSVRRAVEVQAAALPPEAKEAAIKQGLAQIESQFDPAKVTLRDAGAIPHELGHDWYRQAYWPNLPQTRDHYGSPSPDWLDEMAAVLMESDQLFAQRAEQFAERYRKLRAAGASAAPDVLIDLPSYFASEHPAAAPVKALLDKQGLSPSTVKGTTVRVLAGAEAEKVAGGSLRYYLQAAVVSQYLVERTGDHAVFARIGAAFARGETMAQWLANKEPKGKLPRGLKALQADWLSWLDQRFPAEPAKAA